MQRTLTPALLLLFCLAAPRLYAQKPAVQRASVAVPVRNVSAQKSDIEQIDTSLLPPSVRFIPEDYITLPGSFKKGNGSPIDTLDIGDSYLQIVLNDDNTWHYIKNIDKLSQEEVFRSFWSETEVNPYDKVNLSDLGYRNIICLVDSVSTFTCPYQGRVYSKFGYRRGRRHQGLDVPYKVGTPVSCAFDGCVRLSRYVKGYGNLGNSVLANETLLNMAKESLSNSGNFYNLNQMVAEDGSVIPVLFGTYNIYSKRGELLDLNPSRDNVFYYTIGKTLASILEDNTENK